jgi:hypothetical protein
VATAVIELAPAPELAGSQALAAWWAGIVLRGLEG